MSELYPDVSTEKVDAAVHLLCARSVQTLGLQYIEQLPRDQHARLISAARRVEELGVVSASDVDTILCLVGEHCCGLSRLNIGQAIIPHTGLETALVILAFGCPLFKKITVRHASIVPKAARMFWNKLRPQLVFEFSSDNPPFDLCSRW